VTFWFLGQKKKGGGMKEKLMGNRKRGNSRESAILSRPLLGSDADGDWGGKKEEAKVLRKPVLFVSHQ